MAKSVASKIDKEIGRRIQQRRRELGLSADAWQRKLGFRSSSFLGMSAVRQKSMLDIWRILRWFWIRQLVVFLAVAKEIIPIQWQMDAMCRFIQMN